MYVLYFCDAPQCEVYTDNPDELQLHKRDAHWDVFRFRCSIRPCYDVFKKLGKLFDHRLKVHEKGTPLAEDEEECYGCDKCDRTFRTIGMLIHHSGDHPENIHRCGECAWKFASWH